MHIPQGLHNVASLSPLSIHHPFGSGEKEAGSSCLDLSSSVLSCPESHDNIRFGYCCLRIFVNSNTYIYNIVKRHNTRKRLMIYTRMLCNILTAPLLNLLLYRVLGTLHTIHKNVKHPAPSPPAPTEQHS